MNWCLYTNVISPHTVPLAKEIKKRIGRVSYVFQRRSNASYLNEKAISIIKGDAFCVAEQPIVTSRLLVENDVLISGCRDIKLFKARARKHLLSVYSSERWLKPINLFNPKRSENAAATIAVWMPGILRLFVPQIFIRIRQFIQEVFDGANFYYLPDGIHAARDMARLCGLMHGDIKCLFRAPKLDFERRPGGRIWLQNGRNDKRYCLDKMRMWGYFVEQSIESQLPIRNEGTTSRHVRVLWVGRLLKWKRVDTIVRAICKHANLRSRDKSLPIITLDIYGSGPEESRLRRMVKGYEEVVRFFAPLPNEDIRHVMHEHDVYVLSSNSFEGWGAVVSEALEEGMKVIGTHEAGASKTILPAANLYNVGDWQTLLVMLQKPVNKDGINPWSVSAATDILMELVYEWSSK